MESTRLVLVLALFWTGTTGDLDRNSSALKVDLSVAVRRVDRRFLSVTIDASLAAEERFMSLLSSPKVRTLAKALSPSFLRFGGTRQDFMVFTPQGVRQDSEDPAGASCDGQQLPVWLEDRLKKDWTRQQLTLMKEDLQGKYRRVQYTESTVDLLHSFSSCSGMDLVFGLNALLRTSNNTWNSSNAAALLRYCESRQYHVAWELGNEPNSFEKKAGVRVDGEQLGRDFTLLRALMSRSPWQRHAGLYGPDIGQPRDHRAPLLEGFLQTGSDAVDACTWHHYYVNGRDTSLEDFLDPEILDSLIIKTKEVLEKVALVSPQKPVWLGETSSAFGGGAAGLSDTFAAGFMWLDKLGLAALLGLDVVMRQVFIGSGTYHLLDQDLEPLPDYWLSLLYKRLVGQEVLRVEASGRRRVRLYLHCSSRDRYPGGAVTLMTINLGRPAARLRLPARLAGPVEAFMLQAEQPGEEGLTSRSVRLNGQVMKMRDDGTLPDMRAARLPPSKVLQLPAFSLSFFVFTEARAEACG